MSKGRVYLTSEMGHVIASAVIETPTMGNSPPPDIRDLAQRLQAELVKAHEGALAELRKEGGEVDRRNCREVIDAAISDAQIVPAILHILHERLLDSLHASLRPLAEAMADEVMNNPELGRQTYSIFERLKDAYVDEALGGEA